MPPVRTKRRRRSSAPALILCLLLIGVVAAVGVYGYQQNQKRLTAAYEANSLILNQTTFYPGITIDDIPLAGLEREEALGKVMEAVTKRTEAIRVEVSCLGQTWKYSPAELGVSTDVRELVDRAYMIGREGDREARLDMIADLQEGKRQYDFTTSITYNESILPDIIASVSETIEQPAKDATIGEFNPSGSPMFTYIDEKEGRTIDADAALAELKSQMASNMSASFEIPVTAVQPNVRTSDLQGKIKKMVTFSTVMASSSTKSRISNITLAVNALNGKVIMPGKTLSFNESTGPRNERTGYLPAPTIGSDKELVDEIGGGVCQVSTTLFDAAVLAGLNPKSRHPHSWPIKYAEKGQDAMVDQNSGADLVIENNTDSPVYIRGYINEDKVVFTLYGAPQYEGKTVKMISEILETNEPPPPQILPDTQKKYPNLVYVDQQKVDKTPRTGYVVQLYRVVYDSKGAEVSRENIYKSTYKPVAGVILTGTQTRDQPVATPTAPPAETAPPVTTPPPAEQNESSED